MNTYNAVFFDWNGAIADDPGNEFLGELLRQLGTGDAQIQEILLSLIDSLPTL